MKCFKEKEVEYNPDTDLGTSNDSDNISDTNLKTNCIKTFNWIVIAHLNINSLKNKFKLLAYRVKANVDILVVSEIGPNWTANFLLVRFRFQALPPFSY